MASDAAKATQAIGAAGAIGGVLLSLLTSKGSLPWVMVTEKGEEIKGQFTAQDLTESASGQWAKGRTIGRKEPVLQYIGGQGHRLTFTTRIYSMYQSVMFGLGEGHDIVPLRNKIVALVDPDPDLGRPPICTFSLGDDFAVECVVESVGRIKYDEFTKKGTMRGAVFSFTLLEYVAFQIEESGDEEPGDSLNYGMREGDTFERVASEVYGSAKLGVWLAQKHPEARWPQPGQRIRVPDRTKALRNVPAPISTQLSDDGMKAILLDLARERGDASI